MKYFLILSLITLVTYAAGSTSCLGCAQKREGADLKESEKVLNRSLTKLAAGDGPHYEVVKINFATRQMVAGIKDVINADLTNEAGKRKTCTIEIYSPASLANGIRVTIDCPGEEKVVKTHSA